MANITKLEFAALDISGKNYFSWILDVEIHLDAMNLGNTIKEENTASQQDHAKALIFLHHHIDEVLKSEYLTVKDLLLLWKSLKERYDHQNTVILPRTCYDMIHLRLKDFKSVSDYNLVLFKISSQHIHASNMLLQQQYRECDFTKYSKLIVIILLLKNHRSRPTGSISLTKANATIQTNRCGRGRRYFYGRGRGCSRGRHIS